MGHSSINMRFDLYGHLFENTEADRADMAKIEAAVRAALATRLQHAGEFCSQNNKRGRSYSPCRSGRGVAQPG